MATTKEKIEDIYLDINIRRFTNRYFGKTAAWMYQKLDELDPNQNGKSVKFTEEETEIFKKGLYDLSERIKRAADAL